LGEGRAGWVVLVAVRRTGKVGGSVFEQAIGVLAEIGAENELALAQGGDARLRPESGDSDTARRCYLTALETLERLGSLAEPPVIRKALADLNEAASRPDRPPNKVSASQASQGEVE
jgi:hypothetical protein